MTLSTFEKEDLLKELVIKLLEKRELSDYEKLNSLFSDMKKELKNLEKDSV